MEQASFTYSIVKRGGLLRRRIVTYNEKEKDTLSSYFPSKNRKKALKETAQYVSELITLLASPLIPHTIKKKGNIEEIEEIQKHASALYELLKLHCKTASHSSTHAFKAALYRYTLPLYPKMHLSQFTDLMKYAKYACEDALKSYEIPGWKDQHYHTTIYKLANVWIKYSNKPLTRHSVEYEVTPELKGQKDAGPFIEYLKASILPVLPRYNIEKYPSISSIARQVMAKIS